MEATITPNQARQWLDPQRFTTATIAPELHAYSIRGAVGSPPHHCLVCNAELTPPANVACGIEHKRAICRSAHFIATQMPQIYRETDPAKLPDFEAFILAYKHTWQQPFLILNGSTGAGKTRCAWAIAYREALNGT
jgi:hypothetical protein